MAYRRHTILQTATLEWQAVELASPDDEWSDIYRPPQTRIVVPLAGRFGCRAEGAGEISCNPLRGLRLDAGVRYRLRQPHAAQRSFVFGLQGHRSLSRRPDAGIVPLPASLHLRLRTLRASVERGEPEALAVEETVIGHLTGASCGEAVSGHRAVRAAIGHLTERACHNDTIADVALAACCSPFHLARVFRRETGSSLHAFRRSLRMVAALERIEGGERDLAGLALDLGYGSQSHFNAAFRRTFATVPSKVRTKLLSARLAD